jgi:iron complex outermembrane receptor protein
MKKLCLILGVCFTMVDAYAQSVVVKATDSSLLQNVTVTAFETKTKWKDAASTVAVLNNRDLQRFNSGSLLPAFNTIAGVRMEERSPQSYRLSIRGSLLRSPFGVRNIKIYLDGMPLTDATGNTYLNLIDPAQVQSAEIIKGPSSSVYGANTGGVVLLNSVYPVVKNRVEAAVSGGSYGLFGGQASWQTQQKGFESVLSFSHTQSDGYRQQSSSRKDVVKWNGRVAISSKQSLAITAFYTDLFYKTPGGLTQAQFDKNPVQARPATATLPGAVTQQASISNKTAFLAAALTSALSKQITNTTSVVLNHTDFTNPFITNYEKRNEWNYSARTSFNYAYQHNNIKLDVTAGGEAGYNVAHIDDYGNRAGVQDTVQSKGLAHTAQYLAFAQVNAHIGRRWLLQAGASINSTNYNFKYLEGLFSKTPQQRTAGPLVTPRLSALYQVSDNVSVYASVSRGFSTPTLAELAPSGRSFSTTLQPEYGWNYEAGVKGAVAKNLVEFNLSLYYYALKNAIVSRTDSNGVQYFVNAGSTVQKGAELWLKAHLLHNTNRFISLLDVWSSFSYQPYKFDSYTSGSNNYSGNKLTGVPRTVSVSGVDVNTRKAWSASVIFNYTSSIPVDDANTTFAKAYHLLQVKFGKTFTLHTCKLNVYAGIDNALNEVYSLGNDINAVGKRYFNAAPARSIFAGARLTL